MSSDGARSLALVESATQLLNVIEWAHAARAEAGLRLAVLAPRDEHSRRQLAVVTGLALETGLDVELVEVRRAGGALSGAGRLVRQLARADRLVVGDPFSGVIQTLLPLSRASQVVVVDDGTATWEYAECINASRPMLRWRIASDAAGGRSGRGRRTTRLLSPAVGRAVTVFSCLQNAAPVGAVPMSNTYAWTRARSTPEVLSGAVDILGASLAQTGVVESSAYLGAVAALARRYPRVRYLAHRREGDAGIAAIAALGNVEVVRGARPVELVLREGPVAEHVITFPSTAAHTLPRVLWGTGVRIEVQRVDPSWFTTATTSHARRFVNRISDDAPIGPVLEVA